MRKKSLFYIHLFCFIIIYSIISYAGVAGTWEQVENSKWKYKLEDGSYLVDCEKEIEYSGSDEFFRFDSDGFLIQNRTIGNYHYNENGVREDIDPNETPPGNPPINRPDIDGPLEGDKIRPIVPFSSMTQIGGNGKQYDLYGIMMAKSAIMTPGNNDYLTNKEATERFTTLITNLHYENKEVTSFIEALKELAGIVTTYFGIKETFSPDSNATMERLQRDNDRIHNLVIQYLQIILTIIGIILLCGAFALLIIGIIDSQGYSFKMINTWLLNSKLSAECDGFKIAGLNGAIVRTSLIMIVLGAICLSPSLRNTITYWLKFIYYQICNFFGFETIDSLGINAKIAAKEAIKNATNIQNPY